MSKILFVAVLLISSALASCSNSETMLNIPIEMRDGVKLYADIYVPSGEGPFPVILSRVPYGTQSDYILQPAYGKYFTDRGYVYVSQNVRGRFGSEGLFTAYVEGQEIPDAYDTVEWIVNQDWSNDNVGVMGESYYGYTSLMAAVSGHPAVKAISPANITLAREKQSLDGVFPIQASGLWTLNMDDIVNGEYQDTDSLDLYHLPMITLGSENNMRDSLWRERVEGYLKDPSELKKSAIREYQKIRVPALHFGGWYDTFTRGSIAIWNGVKTYSENLDVIDKQWLVIGPWDHDSMSVHIADIAPATTIGKRDFGTKAINTYGETVTEFFDYFLKGKDNGFIYTKRVYYFNIGDDDWREAEEWPPLSSEIQSFYLNVNQELTDKSPNEDSMSSYTYDPKNPITITEGTNIWLRSSEMKNRRTLLERDDILIFETEALQKDLEITGDISLELFASSSAIDTDFTAAIVDVYPDGYSLLIQEGILRASHRNKDESPSHINPNEIYELNIDLWSTSYVIPAGHKLRLEISSSNFPRFARNLNNGEPFGMSDELKIAEQTIYYGERYPSRLLLPVIPALLKTKPSTMSINNL